MSIELLVVADAAAAAAARFLQLRPRTVALAGGQTPRALYRYLARTSYPWAETDIFFGDERCVPPASPDSNYRLADDALLSHVTARVHRMPAERGDAAAYASELERFFGPGIPVFDLVLLGLGEDGHTASLFPGDPALDERERTVVAVSRPDFRRLTLTLPVLDAARHVFFLVTGERKREALRALLHGDGIPAARVGACSITVVADRAAAGSEHASCLPYTGATPP